MEAPDSGLAADLHPLSQFMSVGVRSGPEEEGLILKINLSAEPSIDMAGGDAGLESQSRVECRIAFEDYLRAWLKIATTKAGLLMRKESLEELVKCPDRFAGRYGMPGSASDDFTKDQRRIFKGIMYSPSLRNLKTHSKKKQARGDQMRRLYLLCRTPELLTHRVSSINDPEASECWESEVDNLVSWTHSLSFEELDRQ